MRIFLASSNPGKLREYQAMAAALLPARGAAEFALLPEFPSLPKFEENAQTFAENAAGKALHYSRCGSEPVLADDSGLVVPALGGAPGVQSARYAGAGATDTQRVAKLLEEMRGKSAEERAARFVCVLALARKGRALAVFSDCVEGVLLEEPRGAGGFGYDPVFLYPPLGRTFAEIPRDEKNRLSHRGRAFRKLVRWLEERIAEPRMNTDRHG